MRLLIVTLIVVLLINLPGQKVEASIVISGTVNNLTGPASGADPTLDEFLGMSIGLGDNLRFEAIYNEKTAGTNGQYGNPFESIKFAVNDSDWQTVNVISSSDIIITQAATYDEFFFALDFDRFRFGSFFRTTNGTFTDNTLHPLAGIGFEEVNQVNFGIERSFLRENGSVQYQGNTDWSLSSAGAVPEPASIIIWSVFGCCGLAGGAYRRRKSQRKSAEI